MTEGRGRLDGNRASRAGRGIEQSRDYYRQEVEGASVPYTG